MNLKEETAGKRCAVWENGNTACKVIAVDLGASSGRVIVVSLSEGLLEVEEVHRFVNEGVYVGGRFCTDILYIYREILQGLSKAFQKHPHIDAMGIDSWGVDFALLDDKGELIGNPYHYRDTQVIGMMERANEIFGKNKLFFETGVLDMWYNTVYQVLGIQERNPRIFQGASSFLMIPDILGYFLTGEKSLEYTSVSTTQMYDLRKKDWSGQILSGLGLERDLFPPVVMTGTVKGILHKRVKKQVGILDALDVPLLATAQHDSAAAAYAVPAREADYVFINSGTWSIMGMVAEKPIISREVCAACYSNEGAAFGKIKFVNTVMGMWLIQELRKCWKRRGLNCDYGYLIHEAREAKPFGHRIDVDDELFVAPADMEDVMNQYFVRTGQEEVHSQGALYRTVMESLAFKYREAIKNLEKMSGRKADKLYLLGGAVQDSMFCQFIANATGKVVSAGPVEATALGNALVQMKALGVIGDARENAGIICKSFPIREYVPADVELWSEAYEKR